MSSSDRRLFLLGLAALPLAGCGYVPVYGEGGSAERLRGQVAIAPPGDRDAFDLVARLEDRLGRATAARYALAYEIDTGTEGLAITPEQETTRYNILGEVSFTLTDATNGAVVLADTVDSFTGYSATGSTVATKAARRDARERLMVILADRIVTRLIAAADGLPA